MLIPRDADKHGVEMELPYGKMNFEAEASRLYESDECEKLFAAARERFPGYNDAQSLDALDYVMDGLESAFSERYTSEQWQSIAEHLSEHVHSGLT
jgi:UDP-galactopyranose mutase